MGREASIELDCSRYSDRVIDIINLLNECGWKYYNSKRMVEYLPLGDIDSFNWQDDFFSKGELQELINKKQNRLELVGLDLFYENSMEGVTLLARDTKKILLSLDINRKKLGDERESLTDVSWYFRNIIQKLIEKNCPVDYINFVECTD